MGVVDDAGLSKASGRKGASVWSNPFPDMLSLGTQGLQLAGGD